jgi:Family of unknown function (DUF5988)
MDDTIIGVSAPDTVLAILEGGPESIPEALRMRTVNPFDEKIKLPHYGGYEHFERLGWPDDEAQHLVFRWITRTEVAE